MAVTLAGFGGNGALHFLKFSNGTILANAASPVGRLLADADAFSAPGERLHYSTAAESDAGLRERIEEIEQKMIEHLLGERLLPGQAESCGQFLGDGDTHAVTLHFAAAIVLVSERDGGLHHRASAAFDVELAAREPSQVGWIGGVEQQ